MELPVLNVQAVSGYVSAALLFKKSKELRIRQNINTFLFMVVIIIVKLLSYARYIGFKLPIKI
jgi:hypothetical protein